MLLFALLILIEILTLITLIDYLRNRSKWIFFTSVALHAFLSFLCWMLLVKTITYNSFFDNADHISRLMDLSGIVCAVVLPRVILIVFHFTGKLFRIRKKGYIKWMTAAGFTVSILIFSVITLSTLYTRFNFTTEKVEIKIKDLNMDLEGLRIVQISDIHLSSFYNHEKSLRKAMDMVNALNPDLILNTGDFITYGWREFGSYDTILRMAESRYGNYAIMGNHDFGTYHPFFTEADLRNNVLIINNMVKSSGYTMLNDTNTTVKIKDARIGLIGIITKGRFPEIIHGDLNKALSGLDTVDLKILLSHDPNQWEKDVVTKTDIDITLSGHTHGMQMGIYTKMLRWSPAKYYYPHWNGLYTTGNQVHYVNRGLGVLGIPFRIWMPPEITLITLKRE
jgi:uncharacterized protein